LDRRLAGVQVLELEVLPSPKCSYSTRNRENEQHHDSVWRHLDLGVWRLEVHARLRRLVCPEQGAHVEGVPFARDGARFTRDFDDLVAWLATKTDKTATCRLTRIDWRTIGRVIERVGEEQLIDGDRLSDLFEISVCIENYHVVQLATKALDEVRREHCNVLRQTGARDAAKAFKDSRWSLLKNPGDLTDTQADTLAALHATGGKVPRAWAMKEMVRAIFAPGLNVDTVDELIDRLLARLSRSRLKPFVRLGRTIRKHRQGILAARRLNLSNARAESMNNRVKLIVRRAYGFHSTNAALALVHLTCGPATPTLPHEQTFA
jgi:transposase